MTARGAMLVMCVVLAVLAAASPARADEATPRIPRVARALAERGRASHAAGDYTNAIVAFQSAYALAPSQGLLFNLAQAYRLAGNCGEAAKYYRDFLAAAPPAGDERMVAERHLETAEQCARPHVAALPLVDNPHETVAIAARQARASGLRDNRIGIGLATGGGLALAGAVYFAIDSNDASRAVTAAYMLGAAGSNVAAQESRGNRSADIARALGVGGAVALAAGVMFYALGWRADKDAELARRVSIVPAARGGKVSVTWGF